MLNARIIRSFMPLFRHMTRIGMHGVGVSTKREQSVSLAKKKWKLLSKMQITLLADGGGQSTKSLLILRYHSRGRSWCLESTKKQIWHLSVMNVHLWNCSVTFTKSSSTFRWNDSSERVNIYSQHRLFSSNSYHWVTTTHDLPKREFV